MYSTINNNAILASEIYQSVNLKKKLDTLYTATLKTNKCAEYREDYGKRNKPKFFKCYGN